MFLLSEPEPMSNKMLYFIGVGCNIEPEVNVPAILSRLLEDFGQISISRLCFTEPVGMKSDQLFVNFVVLLRSELEPAQIKSYCNKVEHDFGRDRSDPNRKHLDRRADLDIVYTCRHGHLQQNDLLVDDICDEQFLIPIFQELVDYLSNKTVQPAKHELLHCELGGSVVGQMPTTINLEPGTRHVVVVQ